MVDEKLDSYGVINIAPDDDKILIHSDVIDTFMAIGKAIRNEVPSSEMVALVNSYVSLYEIILCIKASD